MLTLPAVAVAMFLLGSICAYGVLLPALLSDFGWERSIAALDEEIPE